MGVALSITAFPVPRLASSPSSSSSPPRRPHLHVRGSPRQRRRRVDPPLPRHSLSGSGSPLVSLWVLLSGAGFIATAAPAPRPALQWVARSSPGGEPVREAYICATLTVVLASSFATTPSRSTPSSGAFVSASWSLRKVPSPASSSTSFEDLHLPVLLPLSSCPATENQRRRHLGPRSWGLLRPRYHLSIY
ncbi:Cation/H(+) antiporter 19 [Apostasia shenzhenica]|uniref:Cation/H(+) antiporter 19 n=1 Tax=Apostasia shenzhenica TaxID=1088818 RepID=A0A2I0A7J1_9ASPA|nr:Cation/H(+) antiporter 19 [Apostasia shenzhenica]